VRNGTGFGTKTFPGRSNCLRLLAFEHTRLAMQTERVAQLEFEVDDQTPEDLAIALDRLRAHPSVVDVVQAPAFGKKGRIAAQVRLLADPSDLENVLEACFAETTTLGVRHQILERSKLSRSQRSVHTAGRNVRVKVAQRPRGASAKAEADDLLNLTGGRLERERLRRAVESAALDEDDE